MRGPRSAGDVKSLRSNHVSLEGLFALRALFALGFFVLSLFNARIYICLVSGAKISGDFNVNRPIFRLILHSFFFFLILTSAP